MPAKAMTRDDHAHLVQAWVQLWNGEYDLAETIVAEQFQLHAAVLGGGSDHEIHDGPSLAQWIAVTRSVAEDLTFAVEVGPLIDGDHVAVRWRATGHYNGAMPGADAEAGTRLDFTGTDLLRLEENRIAEYWVNADTHVLLAQLGVSLA